MPDSPHPTLLNRDIPAVLAKQYLGSQLELLRNLVNYGSNLIVRTYNSSPKKMADVICCGVLLKQIVSMADAAEVLLSAGCGLAAQLPARSALEASLYIEWIFLENSEIRAMRYLVGNYRRERLWTARACRKSHDAEEFETTLQQYGVDIHAKRPSLHRDAENQLKEMDRILAQPELAPINAEFDEWKKKHRGRHAEWYSLDSEVSSLRGIAKKLGRTLEYESFYAKGSEVTHSGRYRDHIDFRDGKVSMKEIRHLNDANFAINLMASTCIRTFEKFLARYREEELSAFSKTYREEWQAPYMTSINASDSNEGR